MNGNLHQLGDDLRLHLLQLQVCLNGINGLLTGGPVANQPEFTTRLDALRAMMKDRSERTVELREIMRQSLERDAAFAPETVTRWIGRRQTAQLHARADQIEQTATVAVELAMLAAIEAERITMSAVLARREAMAVQVQREHPR
ncbi:MULTISPECIES: hypothetical protein [Bradyrhizobium]|jgi:hypothetical protein|uniref:hypothetical protein n=1 Tax=Bradyrhizobium TaxID=374 RepID=UPI0004040258|nr:MULTISPECIES: hypothetical protein [Bradyrhizobium]AUC97884.1 hypothetical protein CWS35_29290 [Bradyrhizobium sp. SK17]KIU43350.1 hypothetical protein QU41_35310 [Bradyrhizobium elkanii]MBK5655609.1 hypothetical protein [Rhizobium sp.]OCX28571.1 hypothetical protein QU42_21120 [Bradyrhizobium sp. UASWS1016]